VACVQVLDPAVRHRDDLPDQREDGERDTGERERGERIIRSASLRLKLLSSRHSHRRASARRPRMCDRR
jgi:hypothetical protein